MVPVKLSLPWLRPKVLPTFAPDWVSCKVRGAVPLGPLIWPDQCVCKGTTVFHGTSPHGSGSRTYHHKSGVTGCERCRQTPLGTA